MSEPIKLLIELTVDPEKYDLTRWIEDAASEGWAEYPENGVWYLAEDIVGFFEEPGLRLEIIA